jgi:hypothetical protein
MPRATANRATRSHRDRAPLTLATLICLVALAACGSSSKPSTNGASSGHAQFLAFSKCMRSHGVPNFPDPTGGGGIEINVGSGINPHSPAFRAARAACGRFLPGGGPGRGRSAQARQQMLAISTCMRAHGVTGFPDPTTTPPSSTNGYSQVTGRGGVFLAVPDTINPDSPAYRQAAAACRFG